MSEYDKKMNRISHILNFSNKEQEPSQGGEYYAEQLVGGKQ